MKLFFSYCKFISFIGLFILAACVTIPQLEITYQTKPKPDVLKGKELYFSFVDKRSNKDIIGAGAKGLYKTFAGNINLIRSEGERDRFIVGIYDIESLLKKTFLIYLENRGLTLLPEKKEEIPTLIISLRDVLLDLSRNRWTAKMNYEAEFIRDGDVVTRRFKGQAEKFRVSGYKQAHEVMSEIVNDMVHKLDVESLFTDT